MSASPRLDRMLVEARAEAARHTPGTSGHAGAASNVRFLENQIHEIEMHQWRTRSRHAAPSRPRSEASDLARIFGGVVL